MKNFLTKTLLFLIPILLFFVGVEYTLRSLPNAFIIKSDFFKNNLGNINTLILGTSHSQLAINPKYLKNKTANISYSTQDINTDATLFFHYIPKMKNLKTVVFEYSYHRLDLDNPPDYFRFPWYYMFYDVEIKPLKPQRKVSLYFSNPAFFSNILRGYFKKGPMPIINDYGFVEKNYFDEFGILNHDENIIVKNTSKRLEHTHKENEPEVFKKNALTLKKIITYCEKNKIRLIFITTPLYKTYLESEIPEKKKKVDHLMAELIKDYHVEYYDLSTSEDFKLTDYVDDNHLNAEGARKFSLILDTLILKKNPVKNPEK